MNSYNTKAYIIMSQQKLNSVRRPEEADQTMEALTVKTHVKPRSCTGAPHRFKCGCTVRLAYTIQAR